MLLQTDDVFVVIHPISTIDVCFCIVIKGILKQNKILSMIKEFFI